MSKELITAEGNTLPAELSSTMSMFDTGATGFENVKAKDLMIPRITILQTNSPQVTPGKPQYNEKFKAGTFFDTGMNEDLGKILPFLPVHFTTQYLLWAPRDSGKGLQGIFSAAHGEEMMEQTEKDANGRACMPDGNYLVETAQYFGINLLNLRKSYIAFVSTQLKKSRTLMTFATGEQLPRQDGSWFQAPLWYRHYEMGVVPESNAKGSWLGFTIERGTSFAEKQVEDPQKMRRLYDLAMEFRRSIEAGEAKADTTSLEEESAGGGSSGGGGRRQRATADDGSEM